MKELTSADRDSGALARNALLISQALAILGSCVGVLAILEGVVHGAEIYIVLSGFFFGAVSLVAMLSRKIAMQTLAVAATTYYALYLCGGILVTLTSNGREVAAFNYLVWFFPLLVFNKVVNSEALSRILSRFLIAAPLVILAVLFPMLHHLLPVDSQILIGTYFLGYACFSVELSSVTGYREAYIIERERGESRRIESEVLESVSDCFISIDSDFTLNYLNDAACSEFGIDRRAALNHKVSEKIPGFFSASMLAGLRDAFNSGSAYEFEAQTEQPRLWYQIRCFPRQDRMSIFFRNTTAAVLSRLNLEAANARLREQSELLDRAQDAIFISDDNTRVLYWNKGAERLFGWCAAEVKGLRLGEIFHQDREDVQSALSSVFRTGEWTCEISKCRKDGKSLIVESRSTLLRGDDGSPRSVLTINTDITDRKAADAKIFQSAFYDSLTGLPNRLLLHQRLERSLSIPPLTETSSALLLIDLDDFKTLNNTAGHGTGDILLQRVAKCIESCVRQSDTVARFGGDEFVVMLEGLNVEAGLATAEARMIGENVLQACRTPIDLPSYKYDGTASIGVTLFRGARHPAEQLLKQAALAMYRAKALGRNSLCFFDPEMERLAASRASLMVDLKRALQNHEFELHYQPQINRYGSVTGAEALIRWRHAERGMVSPGEFIPLAEAAGLIGELGLWVLETGCDQLALWARQPGMENLTLAVNVSLRQCLDSRFVELVENVLQTSGADPHRLKLEMTESFMIDKADEMINKMTALKSSGVSFSMDDFGTGYSSLSQLKKLPLDQLKIDQSFVRDLLTSEKDASVVRAIIALARSMDLSLIAEGVETEGQRFFLEECGCHFYQGFLFSAALPVSEFERFVQASFDPANRATGRNCDLDSLTATH